MKAHCANCGTVTALEDQYRGKLIKRMKKPLRPVDENLPNYLKHEVGEEVPS